MDRGLLRTGLIAALFLAAVAVMTAAVMSYAYAQALGQARERGEADLALAVDRLSGQMQRYQDMAVLMADHPVLRSGDPGQAQALLLDAADKTSALNLLHVDRDGTILAEAKPGVGGGVGEHVARAMQGALGGGHGFVPDGRRAYFFAAPEFGPGGQVRGALVVAVDIDNVESDWRGSRPAVFFTDLAGGVVFVSNRSELLFWRHDGTGLVPPEGAAPEFRSETSAGMEIWQMNWGAYIPQSALHLARDLPGIGMRAEALIDTGPARRLALLQAAVFGALWLAFGAILFLVTERRRTLAIANRQLEARVEARTAELKSAQADLVQAGTLSALGQMSAGISHELNQPLMAIRQFAENGAAFLERGRAEMAGENLNRISALAARAARIIRNLRAFARNESEPMGRVDLVKVIEAAVELTEARLTAEGIALEWDRGGDAALAYGGEVRLTQVFVNLINNAADAMVGQEEDKIIRIVIDAGAALRVTVRDSGPGIADPEQIFEPFYSTKEVGSGSGEGMGLGLSISYGLVQSFGGDIRGANVRDGRGAMFTVDLEYWREREKVA